MENCAIAPPLLKLTIKICVPFQIIVSNFESPVKFVTMGSNFCPMLKFIEIPSKLVPLVKTKWVLAGFWPYSSQSSVAETENTHKTSKNKKKYFLMFTLTSPLLLLHKHHFVAFIISSTLLIMVELVILDISNTYSTGVRLNKPT